MTTPSVEEQLQAINAKLDAVQEELVLRNRRLAEMEELKDDLSVIVRDMMRAAIVELDDVTPFLETGDLLDLLKKLLRNTKRIARAIDQLESVSDFLADAAPIGNDLFHRFVVKLDELEQKGYFRVGAELQDTADSMVQFLDKHELIGAVGRALKQVGETEYNEIQAYSLWKLYRATKKPEMQRLLGLLMTFLGTLARELEPSQEQQLLVTREEKLLETRR
jgi:hypothetical protein